MNYLLFAIGLVSSVLAIMLFRDNQRLRRYVGQWCVTNEEHAELHKHYSEAMAQAAVSSEQYIKAPKLIALHRNGRLNVWTFARGDELITIETMGLLSDDVEGWRNQLGLDDG